MRVPLEPGGKMYAMPLSVPQAVGWCQDPLPEVRLGNE